MTRFRGGGGRQGDHLRRSDFKSLSTLRSGMVTPASRENASPCVTDSLCLAWIPSVHMHAVRWNPYGSESESASLTLRLDSRHRHAKAPCNGATEPRVLELQSWLGGGGREREPSS